MTKCFLTSESETEIYESYHKFGDWENLKIISYTSIPSLLQSGPQCGLIAISMCTGINIDIIFKEATDLKYTNNGEMFSAQYLADVLSKYNKFVELYKGDINSEKIIDCISNGDLVIVPYDADGNHGPCLKNGHKAHWAVICGLVDNSNNDLMVIARHGKTRRLAFWSLKELAISNAQLNEFSPQRNLSNVEYILPPEGLAGPLGLKNRAVIIKKS